jgi:hypothetical protein
LFANFQFFTLAFKFDRTFALDEFAFYACMTIAVLFGLIAVELGARGAAVYKIGELPVKLYIYRCSIKYAGVDKCRLLLEADDESHTLYFCDVPHDAWARMMIDHCYEVGKVNGSHCFVLRQREAGIIVEA